MSVDIVGAKKRGRKRGSTSTATLPPIIPIVVNSCDYNRQSISEDVKQREYMILSKSELFTINTVTFLYSKDNVFIEESYMNKHAMSFDDICRINSRLSPFICLFTTRYSNPDTVQPVSYTHLRAHETPEHLV